MKRSRNREGNDRGKKRKATCKLVRRERIAYASERWMDAGSVVRRSSSSSLASALFCPRMILLPVCAGSG